MYMECNRLITNAIIYFNSYFLSQIMSQKQNGSHEDAINLLKKISPIAWSHINFYGKYHFEEYQPTSLVSQINEIIQNAIKTGVFWLLLTLVSGRIIIRSKKRVWKSNCGDLGNSRGYGHGTPIGKSQMPIPQTISAKLEKIVHVRIGCSFIR